MHLLITRTSTPGTPRTKRCRSHPRPKKAKASLEAIRANNRCEKGGKAERQRVVSAAVRLADGSIFTGAFHAKAEEEARHAFAGKSKAELERLFARSREGYLTSEGGRFVNFEQAYEIAVCCGQITSKTYAEAFRQLWGQPPEKAPGLEALAFNIARTS